MSDIEALQIAQVLGEFGGAGSCDLATRLFPAFVFKAMEPRGDWHPSGICVYRDGAFIGGVEVRSDDDGLATEPMTQDPYAVEVRGKP